MGRSRGRIVPDFQKLITNLTSHRAGTRYDACEELRVAPAIPQEAMSALRAAANDPDPGVADAARRALAAHSPPPPPVLGRETQPAVPENLEAGPPFYRSPFFLTIAIIAAGVLLVYAAAANLGVKVQDLTGSLECLVVLLAPIVYLLRKTGFFRSWNPQQGQMLLPRYALGGLAAFLGYAIIYYLALVVLALFSPGIWGTKTFEPLPGFSGASLLCAIPLFAIIGVVSANRLRPATPEESVSLARYLRPHVIRSFIIGALLSLPCQFLLLFAAAF